MPPFYLKIWDITKQYWWVFLAMAATCAMGFFAAKAIYSEKQTVVQQSSDREIYESQIKKMKENAEEEERQHAEDLSQLQSDLEESDRKYKKTKEELDILMGKIYRGVVKKYSNDPVGLTNEFSKISGISVYQQEKK